MVSRASSMVDCALRMPRLSLVRQCAALSACTALLAACSTAPPSAPPANLEQIPDATPRLEPLHRFANRPYTVLGRDYVPATALRNYKERGIASWYGRKFHAQQT